MVNFFIAYELNATSYNQGADPELGNCLFGAVRLIKNG